MPLPAPAARTYLNTRQVTYRGYVREDGLFDLEGSMQDVRTYPSRTHERGVLPAGGFAHDMGFRLTLDAGMTIVDVASTMDSVPYSECPLALDPLRALIGCKVGKGWRRMVDERLGGTRSCTHMRELLYSAATAVFQTLSPYQSYRQEAGGAEPAPMAEPAPYMGQCKAWDFRGRVIREHYPQFVDWTPRERR